MTDEPPSPPAEGPPPDEPLVPLGPAQPDPATEWPGFPPQQHNTPVPWTTGFHETPADAEPASVVAPPTAEAEHGRLRMWIAVGIGLQVLALLLWAYFVW